MTEKKKRGPAGPSDEKCAEVLKLFQENRNTFKTARQTGLTNQAVGRIVRYAGESLDGRGRKSLPKLPEIMDDLRKYQNASVVARLYPGYSRKMMSRFAHEDNIDLPSCKPKAGKRLVQACAS